jgi:hypothetical protein
MSDQILEKLDEMNIQLSNDDMEDMHRDLSHYDPYGGCSIQRYKYTYILNLVFNNTEITGRYRHIFVKLFNTIIQNISMIDLIDIIDLIKPIYTEYIRTQKSNRNIIKIGLYTITLSVYRYCIFKSYTYNDLCHVYNHILSYGISRDPCHIACLSNMIQIFDRCISYRIKKFIDDFNDCDIIMLW